LSSERGKETRRVVCPGAACNHTETTVFLASRAYHCTTANDGTVGEFDIDER